LKQRLLNTKRVSIIAEFKRQSPSQGVFNPASDVAAITAGYEQAGVAAVSVLTDSVFFGGSLQDLSTARRVLGCPILRKDFIVDEYQVLESKFAGADVILLIASVLTPDQVACLAEVAHRIGLEVILEIHNEEELQANREAPVDIIGVNNRNLHTFEVSIETSIRLSGLIPDHVARISESGLENPVEVIGLSRLGYHGFLMGQRFMRQPDPVTACTTFMKQVEQLMQ
jgi:indole-3-glycerol phosphate synthase